MRAASIANVIIVTLYLVLVVGLAYGLVVARRRVMMAASDASASTRQAEWQAWRDAAAAQEKGAGPVFRRAPKSQEPPTLRLLRDHFATSLIVLVVLTSTLYFVFAWMVRGILLAPKFRPDLDQDVSSQPPSASRR